MSKDEGIHADKVDRAFTFEEWWSRCRPYDGDARETARQAWDAAITCSGTPSAGVSITPHDNSRDVIEQCARLVEAYGQEADRTAKEYACEMADELAARLRALKSTHSATKGRDFLHDDRFTGVFIEHFVEEWKDPAGEVAFTEQDKQTFLDFAVALVGDLTGEEFEQFCEGVMATANTSDRCAKP